MCGLIYHFGMKKEDRICGWWNCLVFGSYTRKLVYTDNKIQSIIITIPLIVTYIMWRAYDEYITLAVLWIVMQLLLPIIVSTCVYIMKVVLNRRGNYVKMDTLHTENNL